MSGRRLAGGGVIDRARPLNFTFEGKAYKGFSGDTLASALLANGASVVGRSFKYHRPRGLLAAGVEEPNALMQIGSGQRSDANVRATEIELYEGLTSRAVNSWPNVRFDIGAINGLVSRFIPAGFYYKTLMWPNWHLFEPLIRRAAGLGFAAAEPDADRYETRFAHCDVLIVGAGPAGLAAAAAASLSGARVILCEQSNQLGGRLIWDGGQIEGQTGTDWARRVAQALGQAPETTVLTRTTAMGYFDHNALTLLERVTDDLGDHAPKALPRQRLWQVRAKRVVLATGALERPLVFPGNDRPGVMLASAVREYTVRYAVRPGDVAVVFTNNDEAYRTAQSLIAAGGKVAAIVDARDKLSANAVALLEASGVPVLAGAQVIATRGRPALKAVKVRESSGIERWISADLLAMSGGANPTIHLFRQSGGKVAWDPENLMFKPGASAQSEESVGAAGGVLSLAAALQQGHLAGERALRDCGFSAGPAAAPHSPSPPDGVGYGVKALWTIDAPGKSFVDFQNDVATSDIELSARENFVSVEHLKRYTTLGMAPDQGKTSNVNAVAIMAGLTGRSIGETGTTLYRFPFTPLPFGALAGRERGAQFRPIRRLAAHAAHEAAGAFFEEYGGIMRPAYYPKAGESPRQAEQREARAVREGVGLFDGSPLGKIEVVGGDAGLFLDRIYANTMSTLKVGKARYGLMLNELGVVIDDGVTVRLDDNRFLVGTSGGGAAKITAWLDEWLQCEWPDLEVLLAPVTTAWAVLTLSGPMARAVLQRAGTDIDVSAAGFPHMSYREGHVSGLPVRVYRVSFTGEASFEINVPARSAEALWTILMSAGQEHGVAPIGIDAWMLLRTEKGFLHVGADTDGTTAPDDIGWGHILQRKTDFIGRRSLTRPDNLRSDRLQFVGLEAVDPMASGQFLAIGSHIQGNGHPDASEGYVTSAGFSPVLGRDVALGMVKGGQSRWGEIVRVLCPAGPRSARIIKPGVYDPIGARLNG